MKIFRFAFSFPAVALLGIFMSFTRGDTCDRGRAVEASYLFYDVNPGEGFNLRRDVYMRIAVLVKHLNVNGNWILVLPPWGPLYHWKSVDVGKQVRIPWSQFFDIKSLKKFVPVIELHELIGEKKKLLIDNVFYLQNFKEGWTNGKWEEKWKVTECSGNSYWVADNGNVHGQFWKYPVVEARNLTCISFQGHVKKLVPLLTAGLQTQKSQLAMLDRAEIPLHDEYGSTDYWKVRRSMRFSEQLYQLANEFRRQHLNSGDGDDGTRLIADWRDERRPSGSPSTGSQPPMGGPYVCGHLRRQDFLTARPRDVPSIKYAAQQLRKCARGAGVNSIFVASDGTGQEMEQLRSYLEPKYRLLLYSAEDSIRRNVQDGGLAIVEQIICSRARYFIGTHESTFSLRIQEEREILHLASESTFNRFCGGDGGDKSCEQPAKWTIRF